MCTDFNHSNLLVAAEGLVGGLEGVVLVPGEPCKEINWKWTRSRENYFMCAKIRDCHLSEAAGELVQAGLDGHQLSGHVCKEKFSKMSSKIKE